MKCRFICTLELKSNIVQFLNFTQLSSRQVKLKNTNENRQLEKIMQSTFAGNYYQEKSLSLLKSKKGSLIML